MRLVLDSGGIDGLVRQRARLAELRRRGLWPPDVPAVVLAEALTGDHRRDHATNRLLAACTVVAVDEPTCREAARLRTATRRAGSISATDAVVAAYASACGEAVVCTSDAADIAALVAHVPTPVAVLRV